MRQLDQTITEKQTELDNLSYVNSQIEQNELAEMDEQIIALMKVRADILLMQKRLTKADKSLSSHYEVDQSREFLFKAVKIGETGQSNTNEAAGHPI